MPSEREKYCEFARQINVEVSKYQCHSQWRLNKLKRKRGESSEAMRERWWRCEAQSCKRLVVKITKLVEGFEL